jgi:hypothetical protein
MVILHSIVAVLYSYGFRKLRLFYYRERGMVLQVPLITSPCAMNSGLYDSEQFTQSRIRKRPTYETVTVW